MADDPAELVERKMREGIERAQVRQQRIRGIHQNKATISPNKSQSRFNSDGYFSEPGYVDAWDRKKAEEGLLKNRLDGKQIGTMTSKSGVGHGETAPDRSELLGATRPTQSIGDSTIDGLRSWKYDNSAVPNPQLSSSRNGPRPNAHFGVFQRLYEEAFKNPNHAEMLYEKSVKAKIVGPQWVPSCGNKQRATGSSIGFA